MRLSMKLYRLVVLLSLLGAAVAQHPNATEDRQWGSQSGSFRLSISSDKAQYSPGEQIHITAVLKNVTDHPTRLVVTSPFEFYQMDVRLPVPVWIPWKPQAVPTALGRKLAHPDMSSEAGMVAQPGDQRVAEYEINKLYDMSAPGEYRITFSCRQPLRERGDPATTITSNELVVTVVPKKN